MFKLRPSFLSASSVTLDSRPSSDLVDPGFYVHPPTSQLAEQLQIDPQSLANENYSGIFDESGDYIPQYCDDPEKIPRGAVIAPNTDPAESAAPSGVASGPESGNPIKSAESESSAND